ncbi:MAG: hypothetical protein QM667_12845 [Asticcacaulis sp.]
MQAETSEALWRFVRGDTSVRDFENWVYAEEATLTEQLGAEASFALLEMNYADRNQVEDMRAHLEMRLRPELTCECLALSDTDAIDMGGEGQDVRFFSTVDDVERHGDALWWLSLAHCRNCGQDWLIAQEERIYDVHLIRRVSAVEAGRVTTERRWPEAFLTYEAVLKACRERCQPYRFAEEAAASLIWTVHDLRAARPGIKDEEIAVLLGIDVEHVRRLKRLFVPKGIW